MRRIGMLISGGDCQALSAIVKGVAKSLYSMFDGMEIIRFEDGYKRPMYAGYQIMKSSGFSGILTQGDTILGTSRQSFKLMRTPSENGLDKMEVVKHAYKKLKLSCLVMLGENGNQKTADMLSEEGFNVVLLPKVIDNDLWGTDMTLGFQNMMDVATNVTDCIHTTAAPHGCVFTVEAMGYKMDWLILYAGLAGGADIIFPPETLYDISIMCGAPAKQSKASRRFSILVVTKGTISGEDVKVSRKEPKEKKENGVVYPSVIYKIGAKIQKVIDSEARVTVPGRTQRGGEPCAYDRMLAVRLGVTAVRLIAEEQYGYMVAAKDNDITQVFLSEVAGGLRTVDPEYPMIKEAKMVSISSGDEQLYDDESER